jgi:hypothetical protein
MVLNVPLNGGKIGRVVGVNLGEAGWYLGVGGPLRVFLLPVMMCRVVLGEMNGCWCTDPATMGSSCGGREARGVNLMFDSERTGC